MCIAWFYNIYSLIYLFLYFYCSQGSPGDKGYRGPPGIPGLKVSKLFSSLLENTIMQYIVKKKVLILQCTTVVLYHTVPMHHSPVILPRTTVVLHCTSVALSHTALYCIKLQLYYCSSFCKSLLKVCTLIAGQHNTITTVCVYIGGERWLWLLWSSGRRESVSKHQQLKTNKTLKS